MQMLSNVWAKTSSVTATMRTSMSIVKRFLLDHHNRRWVEYADHFMNIGIATDRLPPGWSGWLSHTYDDIPSVDTGVTIAR
jgi:hypothetical protein